VSEYFVFQPNEPIGEVDGVDDESCESSTSNLPKCLDPLVSFPSPSLIFCFVTRPPTIAKYESPSTVTPEMSTSNLTVAG